MVCCNKVDTQHSRPTGTTPVPPPRSLSQKSFSQYSCTGSCSLSVMCLQNLRVSVPQVPGGMPRIHILSCEGVSASLGPKSKHSTVAGHGSCTTPSLDAPQIAAQKTYHPSSKLASAATARTTPDAEPHPQRSGCLNVPPVALLQLLDEGWHIHVTMLTTHHLQQHTTSHAAYRNVERLQHHTLFDRHCNTSVLLTKAGPCPD
jgi:hypothetical protein